MSRGADMNQTVENQTAQLWERSISAILVDFTPALASVPFVRGVTVARAATYVFNNYNQNFLGVFTQAQCAVQVIT